MRSSGDGTAAGGPYAQHGSTPAEPSGNRFAPAATAGGRRGSGRADRISRAHGVRGRGYHLPPAGLLGAYRAGGAERRPAYGSGSQRLYSFRDVVVLKIVKRLLDTGVSLQNIRTAVQHLRPAGWTILRR